MKRKSLCLLAVAFFCIVVVSGCGNPAQQKLVGTWETNLIEAALDSYSGSDEQGNEFAPHRIVDAVKSLAADRIKATVSITFNADGSFAAKTPVGERSGTWQIIEGNAEQAKVSLVVADADEPSEVSVTFQGEDEFEAALPLGLPMLKSATFKRVKEPQ